LADINVWLALSWGGHPHSSNAWNWFRSLVDDDVLFCRFTQIGLLRLLTTKAVMGQDCLTVRKAWGVYDGWLRDPKVEFRNEPAGVDGLFRRATVPFSSTSAPKALGDCYLLASSQASSATLVTLDGGLYHLARKTDQDAVLLT
jgi:toxin-antitoxin system PIN domain toxin